MSADLVTLGAMARRWGVSRAAVYEYVNGKVGSRPAFPEPVRLPFAIEGFEDVRVWSWEDVDSWRRTHASRSPAAGLDAVPS
jgi:predicted DNA-binding transcriptional regulator AlpA